jgi:hypothetical protein
LKPNRRSSGRDAGDGVRLKTKRCVQRVEHLPGSGESLGGQRRVDRPDEGLRQMGAPFAEQRSSPLAWALRTSPRLRPFTRYFLVTR